MPEPEVPVLSWFLLAPALAQAQGPAFSPLEGPPFIAAQVTVNRQQSCAVSRDGRVACWGADMDPTLPWQSDGPAASPRLLAGVRDAVEVLLVDPGLQVRHRDGGVSHVRPGVSGKLARVQGVRGAVRLQRADDGACALQADGGVVCWGHIGWLPAREAPTTMAQAVPLDRPATAIAGDGWNLCTLDDRGLRCWGQGSDDLGIAQHERPKPVDSRVPGRQPDWLVLGFQQACVGVAGRARCWGYPRLETGVLPEHDGPVKQVALSYGEACVLTQAGLLSCTLGGEQLSGTDVTQVALDDDHGCAVHSDGAVSCWGRNDLGQLGDGRAVIDHRPQPVVGVHGVRRLSVAHSSACTLGGEGMQCWGSRAGRPARIPGAPGRLGRGQYHAGLSISESGRLRYVGTGYGDEWEAEYLSGTGGPGGVRDLASDRGVNLCAADDTGRVLCLYSLGGGGTADVWTPMGGLEDVVELSPIAVGFCARTGSGLVGCWSDDRFDHDPDFVDAPRRRQKLRQVEGLSGVVQLATGQSLLCARTASGQVLCSDRVGLSNGWFSAPGIQPMEGLSGASDISSNHLHSCGVVDGAVRCWGENTSGQLGHPPSEGSAVPLEVPLPQPAVAVGVGRDHSCAITADGKAWCWGSDRDGQLGRGRAQRSVGPVRVSGLGPTD